MSPVFRLALGLAAVDGLASAFVATLLLAFFVIGSGEQSAAIDVSTSDVLILKKSSVLPNSGPMTVLLLAALQGEHGSPNARIIPIPGRDGLTPVTDARDLTDGGAVYWFDCSSAASSCRSQLVVTKPRRNKCWHFRLSAANTSGSFADTFPRAINIQATLLPTGDSTGTKAVELLLDGSSWIHIRLYCGPQPLQVNAERL